VILYCASLLETKLFGSMGNAIYYFVSDSIEARKFVKNTDYGNIIYVAESRNPENVDNNSNDEIHKDAWLEQILIGKEFLKRTYLTYNFRTVALMEM
jgi:hypothetical protein